MGASSVVQIYRGRTLYYDISSPIGPDVPDTPDVPVDDEWILDPSKYIEDDGKYYEYLYIGKETSIPTTVQSERFAKVDSDDTYDYYQVSLNGWSTIYDQIRLSFNAEGSGTFDIKYKVEVNGYGSVGIVVNDVNKPLDDVSPWAPDEYPNAVSSNWGATDGYQTVSISYEEGENYQLCGFGFGGGNATVTIALPKVISAMSVSEVKAGAELTVSTQKSDRFYIWDAHSVQYYHDYVVELPNGDKVPTGKQALYSTVYDCPDNVIAVYPRTTYQMDSSMLDNYGIESISDFMLNTSLVKFKQPITGLTEQTISFIYGPSNEYDDYTYPLERFRLSPKTLVSLDSLSLQGCNRLQGENFDFTYIESIGNYAFGSSRTFRFDSVVFGENLTSIGRYGVLSDNYEFTTKTPPTIAQYALGLLESSVDGKINKILVPGGTKNAYKTASDEWAYYADLIVDGTEIVWEDLDEENVPLTFVAQEDGVKISLNLNGMTALPKAIECYKVKKDESVPSVLNFTTYLQGDKISLDKGDWVSFWSKEGGAMANSSSEFTNFVIEGGKVRCYGNVQSLIGGYCISNGRHLELTQYVPTAPQYAFVGLFQPDINIGNDYLLRAPCLYATSIGTKCYAGIFRNNYSLEIVKLPVIASNTTLTLMLAFTNWLQNSPKDGNPKGLVIFDDSHSTSLNSTIRSYAPNCIPLPLSTFKEEYDGDEQIALENERLFGSN